MRTRPLLALDFGTANCMIIRQGKGIVLNEPTVVAISLKDKKVLATGSEAKIMLGKEPKDIIARRPLQNGGISNYRLAFILLQNFLDNALGKWRIVKPDIIVSIPSKLNSIEERALVKALESYGTNKIHLFPEAIAAAIGADLPIHKPEGNMIVNLGGGTAEIALISLKGIVSSRSHVGTGDALNQSIINFFKKEYEMEIGEQTSENIKIKIGNALTQDNPEKLVVSGKDTISGKSRTLQVTSNDILPAIRNVLNKLLVSIQHVLEESPSELVSDLSDRGIALSGGTAMLKNIDIFLTKSLDIPCYIVEDPMSCVVRGLNKKLF